MEGGIVLFFIALCIPGLWLVFSFRRDIKQRLWLEEQRRAEQEQAIRVPPPHRSSRLSAPVHARLPVEIDPPEPVDRGAEPAEKTTPGDESSVGLESWQDLTSSNMGTAFEIFLNETAHPCQGILPSQIDEAFEKFMR